jgi:hypothetical protein
MEERAGDCTRFLQPDGYLLKQVTPTPRLEIRPFYSLPGVGNASRGIRGTFSEIDLLAASLANVGFIEFVRENLLFHATFRALAGKGFEFFKMFQTGAVQWCGHKRLLFLMLLCGLHDYFNLSAISRP